MKGQGVEAWIDEILSRMTLREKIGQMCQVNGALKEPEELIRKGEVGAFLNVVDPETCNRYQRIAMEKSRLGIPLLMGRDVIHGFRTVFPIPLGQAASWHPELIEEAASIAAKEASSMGINWTFAPMVDVARDPRWGRIAEGGGEDPYLTSQLGRAMVRGFQGEDLSTPDRIAACAKHYVGYGAAEGGRDYNTALIPEGTLRDVYLLPFRACVEAGVASLMSAFNEINGIPATGNEFTLRRILKGEWEFDGFVVSDWGAIAEMVVHGFCSDEKEATFSAIKAGVDMEMASQCYHSHLEKLIDEGRVPIEWIDDAIRRILRIKFRLGLFENPYVNTSRKSNLLALKYLEVARKLARESVVLLKNKDQVLPLSDEVRTLAVIGPMADRPTDQMGCWTFDGRPEDVITPLKAILEKFSRKGEVFFAPGLENPRSESKKGFEEAVRAVRKADVVLLFLGEDANLSGEARCRAFLDLPGSQVELVKAISQEGKPVVAVIMTGRPLTLTDMVEKVDALMIAWHPGTMGGLALAELLFGEDSPSGKLPVTFPRTEGQIPIYYAHKNTGRPPQQVDRMAPMGTPIDFVGFFSGYLDVEPTPLYPFGFGLSYTNFKYENLRISSLPDYRTFGFSLSSERIHLGEGLTILVDLQNLGPYAADEVVQLYVRDIVGSVTRPVKELKGFQRVHLEPGERRTIRFTLHTDDLRFYNRDMEFVAEPGRFHLWVGGSSIEGLQAMFEIIE